MNTIIVFLALVSEGNDISVPEKEIIYRQSSDVSLQTADIEGQVALPQGFSDLKDSVPQSKRLLEERLNFKPWDATQLGF